MIWLNHTATASSIGKRLLFCTIYENIILIHEMVAASQWWEQGPNGHVRTHFAALWALEFLFKDDIWIALVQTNQLVSRFWKLIQKWKSYRCSILELNRFSEHAQISTNAIPTEKEYCVLYSCQISFWSDLRFLNNLTLKWSKLAVSSIGFRRSGFRGRHHLAILNIYSPLRLRAMDRVQDWKPMRHI